MTVDLAYTEYGTPQVRETIVLLGSIGSDASMWEPQAHALSDRFRVVCVDHRGHGRSPVPPGPYAMADLGADVLAVLDRLGVAAVHLVGLSLGGAVAQWIAAHHPARVRTLTLLCTSPAFLPSEPWIERAAIVRTQGLSSIAQAVVGRWFTAGLADRDPALIERHLRMVRGISDEGYAGCCEALASWDGRGDLCRIVAPALVIAGQQDPATPPATLQTIADGIAGASLHVLDPGAHLVSVEQAGPVTALIASHIQSAAQADTAASTRTAIPTAAAALRGMNAGSDPVIPARSRPESTDTRWSAASGDPGHKHAGTTVGAADAAEDAAITDDYAAGRAAAHAAGMAVRRQVLGDAHVDRSVTASTEFTAPFQDFITRTAWGDIWNRPGLDHHTRRLLTLAVLTAVGNEHELDMHIRAALRAGTDPAELVEVFLHTAVYAGVPNSNRAFALGQRALAELNSPTQSSPTPSAPQAPPTDHPEGEHA